MRPMKRYQSTLTMFQSSPTLLRVFSALIAVVLTFGVFTTPAFAAGVENIEAQSAAYKAQSMQRVGTNLGKAETILANLDASRYDDAAIPEALLALDELQSAVEADEAAVLEQFDLQKAQLQSKKLPALIMQRHNDMVKHFKANKRTAFKRISEAQKRYGGNALTRTWHRMASAFRATDANATDEVSPITDVNPEQFKRSNQPRNPDFLPTNTLKPNPDNKPKLDKADFTLSGLRSTPVQHYAALGDFTYDSLAGAADPAYLGESEAVVLSDAVKAKAAELNHDPVAIYHWVRNNVEFIPSWGVVQNAQLTLETLRGNAMDIASLSIALLRASKIPARYVHGTIKVDAGKFKNWVGGFSDIMAAGNYAYSAGLPVGHITEAGGITHMAMEHVWVEAAIDFYPSRGARNTDADSWVQFDPGFKQYEYVEGIDAMSIAGIDTEALVNDILNSAEINESIGSVASMDTAALETALVQAQTKLTAYIDTNMTNPSVLDVVGGKKTIVQAFPTLPSSLPNEVLVEGARYAELPQSLKQTVTISLQGTNNYDYYSAILTGDYGKSTTLSYAQANNERVTLSFRPATVTDEEVLASYLPDGNITDASQLPSSLPAHLINVIPEVKLNGEVILTGDTMRLGEELDVTMQAYVPGYGNLCSQTHRTIAGSYLSLNVIAQSVSPKKLQALQARLETTKGILERQDQLQLATLTREDILGDMMHAGSLGYFAQLQGLTELAGLSSKVRGRLVAANGIFGYEPKVTYLFGLPNTVSEGGIFLDIPMNTVAQSLDGNAETTRNFVIQTGTTASALEHQVPEQMFNTDPNNPVQAISAVKALQLANAQGQTIYQIDQNNINEVLPKLNLGADIISDIQNSVGKGKIVTTHTDNVSVPGWSGAGYITIDPVTGDGAYEISGGMNGGWAELGAILGSAMLLLGISQVGFPLFLLGSLALGPLGPFFALITVVAAMITIVYATFLLSKNNQLDRSIFFGVVDSLMGLVSLFGKQFIGGILGLTSGLYTLLSSL